MNIVNLKIILLPVNLFPDITTHSTLMSKNEACMKNSLRYFFLSDQTDLPGKFIKPRTCSYFCKLGRKASFKFPPLLLPVVVVDQNNGLFSPVFSDYRQPALVIWDMTL